MAASGDNGAAAGPIYPATSPNVLAVGGSTLNLTSTNGYASESAWSGSGGGASAFEGEPSYQSNQPSIPSTSQGNVEVYNELTGTYSYDFAHTTPDVAYNANPSTGYAVYDSVASTDYGFKGGWMEAGGTRPRGAGYAVVGPRVLGRSAAQAAKAGSLWTPTRCKIPFTTP